MMLTSISVKEKENEKKDCFHARGFPISKKSVIFARQKGTVNQK